MQAAKRVTGTIIYKAARIAIAVVALIIVLKQVNWSDQIVLPDGTKVSVAQFDGDLTAEGQYRREYGVGSLLSRSDPWYMLAGVGVFSIVPVLLAIRWRILLAVQGISISIWSAVKLTYLGHLLNFFLIGTTSGDLVKAYLLGSYTDKRTEGFVSVFFDRLVGLGVLVVFALVLAMCLWSDPYIETLVKPIALLLASVTLVGVVLVSRRIRRVIRFDKLLAWLPLGKLLGQIDQALLAYRSAHWAIAKAACLTFMLQILSSMAGFFLGRALGFGAQATVWHFLLYVPLAFIIGSIPISVFWGLGLLEGAYVELFSSGQIALATATQAAMLAMAVRLVQLLWSLPGLLPLAWARLGKRITQEPLADDQQ